MIAKLVSAGAVLAALATPALAGDFVVRSATPQVVVRSPAPQVYVQRDRGYGPGDIVAGAVGTAAAIATAPFAPQPYGYQTDSFAYYDGPSAPYNDGPYVTYGGGYVAPGYARPTYRGTYWNDPVGPVCEPGTLVRGLDGRSHLCQ